MLIIFLIVSYLIVKVLNVLDVNVNSNVYKQETTKNDIMNNNDLKQQVYYAPMYKKPHTLSLKKKILRIVYDDSISPMKKPDILVQLMIQLQKYEDTSDFIDSFPEIHLNIFRRYDYE